MKLTPPRKFYALDVDLGGYISTVTVSWDSQDEDNYYFVRLKKDGKIRIANQNLDGNEAKLNNTDKTAVIELAKSAIVQTIERREQFLDETLTYKPININKLSRALLEILKIEMDEDQAEGYEGLSIRSLIVVLKDQLGMDFPALRAIEKSVNSTK